MGIIRNSANRKVIGRIGDTTYYVSMNRQIARQALNSSNYGESARRSPSQQGRRVMWANLVNFYRASKGWMPKAFESKSAKQTDYNRFMSANLPNSRIALTKAVASVSACVVDSFIIAQGSLRSIKVSKLANSWQTDIKLGGLKIGAETTVGQLSSAIIKNNNWILAGDQLSFVSYQQYVDSNNTPHVICTAYEVTLNIASTEILRDYLPEFCSTSSTAGNLGTNTNISIGGFAYILSRNVGGGSLQVSTQQLVTNNDILISQYSGAINVKAAVDSYGVDADNFLDTGSVPVTRTEQPLYIDYISVGDRTFAPGAITAGWTFADLGSNDIKVQLSAPTSATITRIGMLFKEPDYPGDAIDKSTVNDFTTIAADGSFNIKNAWLKSNAATNQTIQQIEVVLSDGQILQANFDPNNPSVD